MNTIQEWKQAVAAGETEQSFDAWSQDQASKSMESLLPAITYPAAEPPRILKHRDNPFVVSYKRKYPERMSLREAVAILKQWKDAGVVVPAEKWRGHALSIAPSEINTEKPRESSTMHGEVWASVVLAGGPGFDSHHLKWWAKVDGKYLKVEVEIAPKWEWLPTVETKYEQGEAISSKVTPRSLGEDSMVKWWTPPGSYRLEYCWADSHNFDAFAS